MWESRSLPEFFLQDAPPLATEPRGVAFLVGPTPAGSVRGVFGKGAGGAEVDLDGFADGDAELVDFGAG